MVIDAHQHLWNPTRVHYDWLGTEPAAINRPIEFEELEPILSRAGVSATVLVQSADNDEDTDYMFEQAGLHPQLAAIVGWVPLDRPDVAAARLEVLAGRPGFVGVRSLIHNQADPDWLLRSQVDAGLALLEAADLPFDLVSVLPRHLEHVGELSERHPRLRMVIDHLSKPPIRDPAGWDRWRALIRRAAQNPLVHAKVSGLYPSVGDPLDWSADDIRASVDVAVEAFGVQRLMYGGDWPISVLFGGYDRVWTALNDVFAGWSVQDREAVLGVTASSFYRIDPARIAAAQRAAAQAQGR